jgi:N-acetylglucosaminyldiphosphoundecaprenol N-acetyl-beta-D-mannosaminyltransferase
VTDETDASDVFLLELRDAVPDQPVVVVTTPDRPVIVESVLVRPVIVEAALETPVVVPVMRDGDVADASPALSPTDVAVSVGPPRAPAASQLRLGPFQISDLSQADVVSTIVSGTVAAHGQRAFVAFALHVGGLNQRRDADYLQAMSRADIVYADGISVVVLAKLAGARAAERAGTTDIGWSVLRQLSRALGRPAKVALVGGPDGLTQRAAQVIEADAGVEVVLTEHGYYQDWSAVLERLGSSGCDVVLVGLGAPREMTWVDEHAMDLPRCLVMTCGGWFGFITQDEKRAPRWVRDSGLEWTYRLKQSPRRLLRRYAKGAVSTAALAVAIRRTRSRPV